MRIVRQLYNHTYAPKERLQVDLTLSENPLGCSDNVKQALIKSIDNLHRYPDKESVKLRDKLARKYNISSDNILLGAGANQLLEDILRAFALGGNIVTSDATFPEPMYGISSLNGYVITIPLTNDFHIDLKGLLEAINQDTCLVYICNPNNPTGIWEDPQCIVALANRSPVPVLVCEAGADFIGDSLISATMPDNVLVVRSLSKSHGLAGLRVGYVVAASDMIKKIKETSCSYKLSLLAQEAALAALDDENHVTRSIDYMLEQKNWLMRELSALGFTCVPSQGQTCIVKIPDQFSMDARLFCQRAKEIGVGLLDCSMYQGLDRYIRIAPNMESINKSFIEKMKLLIQRE